MVQTDRFSQINQKRLIMGGDQTFTPQHPLVIAERHQIGNLPVKRGTHDDICGWERCFSHAPTLRARALEVVVAENLLDGLHPRQSTRCQIRV